MSQTGVVSFSQTAATNSNADSTVNWAEGQAPSSINDSARALMASVAKYRDDISGAIVTTGTSTAYAVSSYQVFSSLSVLANQVIAFTPHTTCGSTVTLNVDSLGAKPLRTAPSVELPAGTIIQGTPYLAVYNASDAAFYLQSFFGNPYGIPIGASVDFWGSTAPNSSFVLAYGQAISRSTYSSLFSILGTTYGTGDGSTTFNLPDCRGRIIAGKDDMGGAAASRLTSSWFGSNAATLGAANGNEKNALSNINQVPQFTPAGTISNGTILAINVTFASIVNGGQGAISTSSTGTTGGNLTGALNLTQGASTFSGTPAGSASPSSFAICQPTIIANKLIRII